MTIDYEIILRGNNLRLGEGFLGLSNATLILAPDGPIMFDTGHYCNRATLLAGLKRRGMTPADIKTVFLSHLHFDHCNNIDLFPDATVYVSRREWDYARAPHERDNFVPWLIHEQLQKHNIKFVEGEGRITDGVTYFAAPGHTPGSYALELDSDTKGRVVLAGDAIKYITEVMMRRSDFVFDTVNNSAITIGRILESADRIVPGHYPELIKRDGVFVSDEAAAITLVVR